MTSKSFEADTYKALVNGTYSVALDSKKTLALQLTMQNGSLHVLMDEAGYKVEAIDVNRDTKVIRFRMNGRWFSIQLRDAFDELIDEMGFREASGSQDADITAPMPGLVLAVHVSPGDKVETGTPLLILEAMKMENVIVAPSAGIVDALHVAEHASVSKGALLVSLRPPNSD